MDVSCGFCKFYFYMYLVNGHRDVVHQIWHVFPSDSGHRVRTKGIGISNCTRWADFVNMTLYLYMEDFYMVKMSHIVYRITFLMEHLPIFNSSVGSKNDWFRKCCCLSQVFDVKQYSVVVGSQVFDVKFISSSWSDVSMIQKMKIVYLKFLLDLKWTIQRMLLSILSFWSQVHYNCVQPINQVGQPIIRSPY